MQALLSVVIRRPFHWGIVVVANADTEGPLPDVDADAGVSANEHGVVAGVRHAHDVDAFGAESGWAEVEVAVRVLSRAESVGTDRREIFRGALQLHGGRVSIGDADGDVIVSTHRGWNHLVITVDAAVPVADLSPDAIAIDLVPASSP